MPANKAGTILVLVAAIGTTATQVNSTAVHVAMSRDITGTTEQPLLLYYSYTPYVQQQSPLSCFRLLLYHRVVL